MILNQFKSDNSCISEDNSMKLDLHQRIIAIYIISLMKFRLVFFFLLWPGRTDELTEGRTDGHGQKIISLRGIQIGKKCLLFYV